MSESFKPQSAADVQHEAPMIDVAGQIVRRDTAAVPRRKQTRAKSPKKTPKK